jgi:acetyltransferase-like isoleucine patch superfamily enzyme
VVTDGDTIPGIEAEHVVVGQDVRVGAGVRICARSVRLGDGVSLSDDVTVACDELIVDSGVRIGPGCTFVSPHIAIGTRTQIGAAVRADLNEHFVLGRLCDVGHSVRLVGQGVRAGDYLWLTDEVTIGGGGARGPNSYLVIGDRSAIMDRCFINLSDTVSIGSDTALSNGVTVLTHSLWQPVLDGGTASFAPVRIGDRCILYVNAVIAPGVTIGCDVTIGAGALVLQDVPDASTAIGNPARIIKSTPAMPRDLPRERQDAVVREVLAGWAFTLAVKGVPAQRQNDDTISAEIDGQREIVAYVGRTAPIQLNPATTISLAFGPAPQGASVRCHFDLLAKAVTGEPRALGEDLRDYLRRQTIRIYSDRPFQSLLPANLARLRARLHAAR